MSDGSFNQNGESNSSSSSSSVSTAANQTVQHHPNELISVRDIYLILRKGLPLILLTSLILAGLTFLYFTLKDDVFEASATASVAPSGLDIRNSNGISFSPQTTPAFETYKSLAYSDSVVNGVIESVKEQYPALDIGVSQFKRRASIDKIYGPLNNRPDTADRVTLAVSHKIRHENGAISVALTNAWTENSIKTVQETLSGSLDSVDGLTKTAFETARQNLEKTQEALKDASGEAALDVLDAQVLIAGEHIAEQKVRWSEANVELEVAKQLQNTFLGQTGEGISTLSPQTQQLLEVQLQLFESELESAFAALESFHEKHDLLSLEARNIFLSIQLAEFEQLLSVAKASTNGIVQVSGTSDLSREMLENALLDSIIETDKASAMSIDSEIIPAEQREIIPRANRVVSEVDSDMLSKLGELRNYLNYQNLRLSEASYTVGELEATIATLTDDLVSISTQYGPLKVQENRLQLDYDLAEQRLTELLAERSRLSSKNEGLLIALEAEVQELDKQITVDEVALQTLQTKRAEAQQTVGTLMIELEAATKAYEQIGGLEPTISYISQLAPVSAQVINLASTSLEPIGTGRSLPTVLAFLLTAIIMTVLVFFREAIK